MYTSMNYWVEPTFYMLKMSMGDLYICIVAVLNSISISNKKFKYYINMNNRKERIRPGVFIHEKISTCTANKCRKLRNISFIAVFNQIFTVRLSTFSKKSHLTASFCKIKHWIQQNSLWADYQPSSVNIMPQKWISHHKCGLKNKAIEYL